MDGILNVYKEAGFTSFDVVAKLRGILKQKKIGHTGTLDPDAEGVLVLCLGNATKLCEMLTGHDKEYTAVLRLGVTTDTEDSSGAVLTTSDVTCTEEKVKEAVLSFIGKQEQIPPMYSAIKKDGKRLYTLAHQGISIEREPRPIEIYKLEIIELALPLVTIRVQCSKGTYIRSLCRDIGEKLGCGGIMEHLLRNRVAQFTDRDAVTLSEIEECVKNGTIREHIHPIPSLFPEYGNLKTEPHADKYLLNGNPLTMESFAEETVSALKDGGHYFVSDHTGALKGLYRYSEAAGMLKPYKMFLA